MCIRDRSRSVDGGARGWSGSVRREVGGAVPFDGMTRASAAVAGVSNDARPLSDALELKSDAREITDDELSARFDFGETSVDLTVLEGAIHSISTSIRPGAQGCHECGRFSRK